MDKQEAFGSSVGTVGPVSGRDVNHNSRRFALIMLIIVYTFNFIDRQIMGILAIPIQAELKVSDTTIGIMRGLSFALLYSTLAIPVAWLADHYHRVRIIGASLAIWSAFTAACGAAATPVQLFFARMGVGVGEAGGVAPAYSILSDYYPADKRARAIAIYSFGIPIGTAIGVVFGGVVATVLDWRTAFFVVGIAGLLLAPVFLLTVREPERQKRRDTTAKRPLKEIYHIIRSKRSFWLMSFGAASSSIMAYGLFAWLPALLVRSYGDELQRDMPYIIPAWLIPADAGPVLYASYFYAAIALIGGMIGLVIGGVLADKLGARHRGAYALIPSIAFLLTVPLYFAGLMSDSLLLLFFVLLVPTALGSAWLGPIMTAFQNIVPEDMRATTVASFLLINNLLGLALGDIILGALSDTLTVSYGDDSLRISILIGTAFYAVAAFFLLLASRTLPGDWEAEDARPTTSP